jgi:DNA-binding response OmpR family regulator
MAKILLVEDDMSLSDMIRDWLKFERHIGEAAYNGDDALNLLSSVTYDLIILDWDLPGLSGIEVCKLFRERGGNTPILMLTGKSSIDEKVVGFNSGTDDYLTKPFETRELAARVRALLRRSPVRIADIIKAGNLELNTQDHRVLQNGVVLNLAPREYALLEFFMKHPKEVFSPEALLARVWQSDSEASRDTVRVCITRLRQKLGEDPKTPNIRSVFSVGYTFEPDGIPQ